MGWWYQICFKFAQHSSLVELKTFSSFLIWLKDMAWTLSCGDCHTGMVEAGGRKAGASLLTNNFWLNWFKWVLILKKCLLLDWPLKLLGLYRLVSGFPLILLLVVANTLLEESLLGSWRSIPTSECAALILYLWYLQQNVLWNLKIIGNGYKILLESVINLLKIRCHFLNCWY